ncbi:leucine-rich repeat-containing protein 23 isoform X1 [Macaca nemestrina]|uniref:leucine-rich repeat-containing protein 23 isoform X1 n=1 Tax=Macaca nemestrina TaxID=9545 RepID=UPI0039B9D0C8
MSDEDDLEDFEPDQDDFEKEEDEKETEEGEDYRKEGEEFPEEWLPTPLTEDMMKEGLSLLCKTGSGLAHAYVKLEVKERDLTDIYLLRSYIHLRYVDVSENHLTDLSPLNYLTHLLWLKADGNRLRSAQLNELPYLQIASFAYNQITDTEGISHPRLETLNLKGNRIHMVTGLDPQKLISLHTVELRGNQLESTVGINLPKLKNLYLAQNLLKKVEGLEDLSNLTTLHLRDNQIDTLSGFSREMKSLQYLNLRRSKTLAFRPDQTPRGATTFIPPRARTEDACFCPKAGNSSQPEAQDPLCAGPLGSVGCRVGCLDLSAAWSLGRGPPSGRCGWEPSPRGPRGAGRSGWRDLRRRLGCSDFQ